MSILTCPICAEKLDISGKCYRCAGGHSFDMARSGYVNLLLSKHIGKTVHGDNKLMVQARRKFLDSGYYTPLAVSLCDTVEKYFHGGVLLDAGCGEGYYTSKVAERLRNCERSADIYGIDVSKIAVDHAAKRNRSVKYAAASVFHIPVESGSCHMLITLFAPYCGGEFTRVLAEKGIMIMAIPSRDHLWELKQAIYDVPYKNEVRSYELEGFDFLEKESIRYTMHIASQEELQALFSMTPYYYRTGKKQQERLVKLTELDITADFELLIYQKIERSGFDGT